MKISEGFLFGIPSTSRHTEFISASFLFLTKHPA